MGRELAANIVALGALVELSRVVSPGSLEAAVLARVPPGTEELNRKALEAGIEAARQFLAERTESDIDADSLDE